MGITKEQHKRAVLTKLRAEGVNIKTASIKQIEKALQGTVLARKNIVLAKSLRRKK